MNQLENGVMLLTIMLLMILLEIQNANLSMLSRYFIGFGFAFFFVRFFWHSIFGGIYYDIKHFLYQHNIYPRETQHAREVEK